MSDDRTPAALDGDGFRLIVEASPNAMLLVDGSRRIALVNRGTEALFGYTREELVGRTIETLIPERLRGNHPEHVQHFLGDPRARAMGAGRELFGLHKDGTEIPIEIGLNPVTFPTGIYTLASVIDISERKKAEERFRLVVEAAPNAMLMADVRGLVTLVNRRAEELFQYRREELVGQPLELLIPARSREQHPEHLRQFLAAPEARPMGTGRELFGRRKDGSEVPVEIGLNPIETPDGSSVLASIIDITARKRTEAELRRSNAELEQFAQIASHDLQEPLRMVASYTELLAERYRGKLDERADKYIHYAVDGAKRMQRLVADLLAYSRVGSQGRPLEPVSTASVVRDVLSSIQGAVLAANATIEIGPLPEVLGDHTQLTQLFQNLIGNAMKFHRDEPPVVSVHATLVADRWRFAVQDNGIGIDMQYADRVFQMFQRLHGRGEYEGSGIGLAIAKRIVERHAGHIWLESEVGRGTTVNFTLTPIPPGGVR